MKKNIEIIRHSLAHILASAVKDLYPKVKFGVGPAIENGFYYDFDFAKTPIKEDDLAKIEKKMREIIKKNLKFQKKSISLKEAKKIFKDQPYKLELIKEKSSSSKISIYQINDFIDFCKGPHVKLNLKKEIPGSFKLTKIAGAYWKGDEKNPMLTRIYGLAFENKKELEKYLKTQEEADALVAEVEAAIASLAGTEEPVDTEEPAATDEEPVDECTGTGLDINSTPNELTVNDCAMAILTVHLSDLLTMFESPLAEAYLDRPLTDGLGMALSMGMINQETYDIVEAELAAIK